VLAPQNVSVPESAIAYQSIFPAIFASQPQGLALNFTVFPTTTFGIGATTGVLFVQPSVSLSYALQPEITLSVTVVSSAGTIATAPLTVFVTQVNKPPTFNAPAFFLTVNESSAPGIPFGSAPATSTNIPDTLTYSISGVNPSGATGWFRLTRSLGSIAVSPSIPGGVLLVDRALTYPAGPWTVNVSLVVRNAGGLTANATAVITVANIAPRVTTVNASIPNNATGWPVDRCDQLTALRADALLDIHALVHAVFCRSPQALG